MFQNCLRETLVVAENAGVSIQSIEQVQSMMHARLWSEGKVIFPVRNEMSMMIWKRNNVYRFYSTYVASQLTTSHIRDRARLLKRLAKRIDRKVTDLKPISSIIQISNEHSHLVTYCEIK